MKIQKNWVGGWGVGVGGHGRCEQRSDLFVKNQGGGGRGARFGRGVRVDVNEELKLLKKSGVVGVGSVGLGGQRGCGCKRRIEVFGKNKKQSGVGFGGQGGCEQRIEAFVKIQKENRVGGCWVGGQVGVTPQSEKLGRGRGSW